MAGHDRLRTAADSSHSQGSGKLTRVGAFHGIDVDLGRPMTASAPAAPTLTLVRP